MAKSPRPLLGNPAELVGEGEGDLGFEEALLLLRRGRHYFQCIKYLLTMSTGEKLIMRRFSDTSSRA